jgi:hypothetical protein
LKLSGFFLKRAKLISSVMAGADTMTTAPMTAIGPLFCVSFWATSGGRVATHLASGSAIGWHSSGVRSHHGCPVAMATVEYSAEQRCERVFSVKTSTS